MTCFAPMDRTVSTFVVLHTPVTSASNDLAICTANVPTPPDAPLIRTFCPGCTFPTSRSAWRAASAEVGTAAACSNVRLTGLSASLSFPAHAYSAQAPLHAPNTSSPGRNCFTLVPTASTCPATSNPGIPCFGLSSPVTRRMANGAPLTPKQSPTWRPAARTRTSTSSSLTTGWSMSLRPRTSNEPYWSWTIARISSCQQRQGERDEHRRQQRIEPHGDPGKNARHLVYLKRARGADAVGGEPDRKAAGAKIAHANEVHQRRDQDRADDAGQDHQHRGQGRIAAERLGDAHGDARGDGFRRKRDQHGVGRAERLGDQDRRRHRHDRAGQQRGQHRHRGAPPWRGARRAEWR